MMSIYTKADYVSALKQARSYIVANRMDLAERLIEAAKASPWGQRLRENDTTTKKGDGLIRFSLPYSPVPDTLPSWVKSGGLLPEDAQLALYIKGFKATNIESQSSLGGFAVPQPIADRVMARTLQAAVVRPRATLIPATSDFASVPVISGGSDTYSSGMRGQWQSETQVISTQNLTMGAAKVPINLLTFRVKLSKSLIEDGTPQGVVDALVNEAAKTIRSDEDQAFLVGSGIARPLGILATQADGVLVNESIRVTDSGNSATITGDSVVASLYSLPASIRESSTFCATMNADTMEIVRKLKDSTGSYIFSSDSRKLLGHPVAESEHAPAIASNAFPLVWGDFEGYAVCDRIGLAMIRHDDSNTAQYDEIWFDFRKRLGGQVAIGSNFSALRVHS